MGADDQTGFLCTYHLSVVSRRIKGAISRQLHTSHTFTEPPPASAALLICRSPWIYEVVSITVHVHQLDSIGNETRQTRQCVSSHQQSNIGIDGPRRGVTLCVLHSTKVHEWVFGSESPFG
ncbi:uncharacterized protein TNCV_2071001 [Trichonephila clavipes]|uniref:Uncharacterized protein n=1 Tax=Trichonephila clavipes TaxID=2585209 RepID=A0A8X7BDB9_TRICX|nr:uncharacterized protein TNCV_2071001 [Trichonephila clavipes]